MKVDLMDRIALVTDAAGGIGRCIALALAENGARVAVNDVKAGERTCEEIRERGGQASFFPADVSDPGAVNILVAKVEHDLGPIDVLVNNAGVNVGNTK